MIKKFYISEKRDGYLYDRTAEKWFSWAYDIRINGKRIQERGFPSRALAENAAAKKKLDEKNARHGFAAPLDSPYLIELMQKKLDSITVRRDRTRTKRIFEYFLNLPDNPKQLKVHDLKTAHIQNFITARIADGVTAATVRRELVPVMAMLNNANIYFAALDDFRPPKKPPIKVSKQRNELTIKPEWREKLFKWFFAEKREDERSYQAASRRRCGQFLQTLLLTVSRPGEIAALKRSAIDFEKMTVAITGTKTRFTADTQTRIIRITPTLEKIFRERMEISANEFLFTRGGFVTAKMYLLLKKACEMCGIPHGRQTGVTFHTARHTAITDLIESNLIDLKTAGRLAGHSDQNMTMYYTHPTAGTLDKAAGILEEKNAF